MQLALSLDTCVPLAPQHDFPPAKDELAAANTPAATNAKVVLIMHLRQHELRNVQCVESVVPSRGDGEGPRYVSGRCKLASVISAVFVSIRPRSLLQLEFDPAVFGVGYDSLSFTKFSLENVDAQRIEEQVLDRAFPWSRAINRIITLARNDRFC